MTDCRRNPRRTAERPARGNRLKQASAYVNHRAQYYGYIGDDCRQNDCDFVVDRLQWLLKNDKQFRQNG